VDKTLFFIELSNCDLNYVHPPYYTIFLLFFTMLGMKHLRLTYDMLEKPKKIFLYFKLLVTVRSTTFIEESDRLCLPSEKRTYLLMIVALATYPAKEVKIKIN
jgi:hypothetical protein